MCTLYKRLCTFLSPNLFIYLLFTKKTMYESSWVAEAHGQGGINSSEVRQAAHTDTLRRANEHSNVLQILMTIRQKFQRRSKTIRGNSSWSRNKGSKEACKETAFPSVAHFKPVCWQWLHLRPTMFIWDAELSSSTMKALLKLFTDVSSSASHLALASVFVCCSLD